MITTLSVEPVEIPTGIFTVRADLRVPATPVGLVVFTHGSGSSRFNPHHRHVADVLGDEGFATVLLDLLTASEEAVDEYTARYRFDIERLAHRVSAAIDWAATQEPLRDLPVGCFGASTGAAAALVAAANRPASVAALVSRDGTPDLAGEALTRVHAPTLLIVGGENAASVAMNRSAMQRMRAHVELEIVAGATHLVTEPGAVDRVAQLAARWFHTYLAAAPVPMTTVPREDWSRFVLDFSRRHRGWLTSVTVLAPGAPPEHITRLRPLEAVELIHHEGRIAGVEIRFGDADLPPSVMTLTPDVLRVDETPHGERGLEVEDRDGLRTVVHFRATALPEELDGVASREL